MNPNHDNREDECFGALFASVNTDTPPPDLEFLDRLREQSAEVFAAESSKPAPVPRRRRRMITLALRGLAAATAAAVLATAWLWAPPGVNDSAVTFGTVLENVARAETLHLKITREGKTGEIWARQPDQLRWDEGGEGDGVYRIAKGPRLWLVDEKANRAASGPSPYFRDDPAGLDPLALLDLPAEQHRKGLLESRPSERVRRDGLECDLYRMEIPAPEGKLLIEALVDAGTQRLRWIETKADRDGRLETVGTLTVVAVDEPVDEALFVVGDTLTEDGRVGKVTDAQGIVSVRPVMARRWTPVAGRLLLKPGDWVRTDLRGANAVAIRLVKQTGLTLGPGSLVEVVKPNRIRVVQGEFKLATAEKAPVVLVDPAGQEVKVEGKHVFRVRGQKLVRLAKSPLWLQGFEGATANESIGSLVATVDGQNLPLTVGYHKVTVDVRDQIARTVIEESFVNHTAGRLEGIFYFPLPQDASISGFGMWIGDELVEADVVEKQRAREIYETILREDRDPGLLEWSGGNLFKARVFPIPARSEKRIKITYTQVLPLRDNAYRYSYGLQSEMLKQHPLRELALEVNVNSAVPLASVTSPTHATRNRKTKHSAKVEFSAQEYSPTSDFEVVVELEGRHSDVVMIPHRRGDDGYFMLQLMPPADDDGPGREILPDGQPVELVILADTSASIDAGGRVRQAEFVASILSALTANDTFNLAGCDVSCQWAFPKPVPADEKNVDLARGFLAGRTSLGWTDLDAAFASALKQSGPKTQVIYVGDGIVTGADSDPVAFTKRLHRLFDRKGVAAHAVALGSSFEPLVLRSIASLGGGSVRRMSGERGPQAVALELLGEIARPAIRDLAVEFRGLRTARIYPDPLPNLPAGTQQILLGIYLPEEGGDQLGEVVVTGMRGDTPVRINAPVSLAGAEQGNSFIPRLWARMHLDVLLEQGTSQAIRDEIIGLSEEYHIITPYTSLLVLETDADRERFKVKRRFQIRDGEKYFATGRDNVDYELKQQQMRRAGDWRLGLRRAVLRQLLGLGRDPSVFQPSNYYGRHRGYGSIDLAVMAGGTMGGMGMGGLWCDYTGFSPLGGPVDTQSNMHRLDLPLRVTNGEDWGDLNGDRLLTESYDVSGLVGEGLEEIIADTELGGVRGLKQEGAEMYLGEALALDRQSSSLGNFKVVYDGDYRKMIFGGRDGTRGATPLFSLTESMAFHDRRVSSLNYAMGDLSDDWGGRWYRPEQYTSWLGTLFPHLPPAPSKEKEPEKPWPAAARAVAKSLLRVDRLAALEGGLEIDRRVESFNVREAVLSSRRRTRALVAPAAWLIRSEGDNSQTTVAWCNGDQRGILSEAFGLGRLRASTPSDLRRPPLGLDGYTMRSIERTYQDYSVELKPQGDERTLLVLKHPSSPEHEVHVLVDTARHVILSIENRQNGKVTSTQRFGDFLEVAGCWWAGRVERFDAKGRRSSLVTLEFKPMAGDAFNRQVNQELAGREAVQFLHEPPPTLADAKRAVADTKATFDDHLALLLHFAASQQWDRVMEHLDRAEALAAGKPGIRWVRSALLNASRRREELRQRILDEAARLAQPQPPDPAEPADPAHPNDLFLAGHLLGQSGGILEANEMLGLLDVLRPVYARQPSHLHAMKRWSQDRVNYLRQAGQSDRAIRLRKQLAAEYPHDYSLQEQYAQDLANAGEHEAALAWLQRAIDSDFEWLPHEDESLRGRYAGLLRSAGRYPELVEFLTEWVERNPAGTSAYQQYLSALVWADREEEANGLIARWLAEGRQPDKLARAVASRLQAAVSQALGQGYNLHTDRIDERWLAPLADAAWFFARHESQLHTATRIMGQHRFRQSDECRGVRKKITGVLLAEIDTLRPEQIARFVDWIWPNDPAVEAGVWKRIAAGLTRRWSAEPDHEVRSLLAQPLVQILSGKADSAELLDFLREQLRRKKYRNAYNQLFNTLLGQPWSAEYEDEAFALLEDQAYAADPPQQLALRVAALHKLTDAMVRARFDARMKTVEHQEELTRIELREKKEENLRLARQGFADRLRKEIAGHARPLADWINIERLYLDVLAGRDLARVEAECWELLGPKPPGPREFDPERAADQHLDILLRSRVLVTLANLAARKDAKPELVDRLLKYAGALIAADPKDDARKLFAYQLLIALDRPKDLEQSLRLWIRSDDPLSFWRLSLGYLLAEQGQIDEAIGLFEAVEAADELGPDDYRALANWYMVDGRRREHDRAMIAVYKTTEEWRLSNWLSAKLEPWRRTFFSGQVYEKLPGELDREVLLVFAALFEKSGQPHQYLGYLRQFYQATHDFRLLAGLADGVVGHTAARVYPFLEGMNGVLAEVRDEATADSVVEHLAEVRKRAKTTVDRRALDLLEVLVERRSAEVLNQPGPHVEAALGAMQRAFRREWSPGEPRLMADLLAGLGQISQPELAAEQIRELEVLHEQAARGSLDRLHIAHRLANARWSYEQHNEAIDLLQAALEEFLAAVGGRLPVEANDPLATFVSYLEQRIHHARGEKVLLDQLGHPANTQQKRWLTRRLYELYEHAIGHDGDVSLGTGAVLYRAVQRQLRGELDTPDHNHRSTLIDRLSSIYRTAHRKKLPGVVADLKAFAFGELSGVLERQTNNYESVVSTVAGTVHDLAGPRDGLAFLIERIEEEPGWLRYNNRDAWSRQSWNLGQWRREAKQLGDLADLEDRLLAIVTAELRRDLESRQSRSRNIYHNHHSHFWREKADVFAKTAEEVLARRKHSGAAVQYIADYLYHGLDRCARAIEILFAAHAQGILDESGQSKLVEFLHEQNRHGESIAILQPLVERRPDTMQYRVWLMHAYFRTDRHEELLALLAATDAHFHQQNRWQESAMASLAASCLENRLYRQSIGYYEELIPLHQRTQPRRGIGNGTLSEYYSNLADAHAGLGQTAEAVDAACGAIVSWGPKHENRQYALDRLKDVIRQAPKLDLYVAGLDKQADETEQENPIVRKALGQVYLEKEEYAKAIAQLKLACRLQPNDTQTHQALIDCYDKQGDKEGAVGQLLNSLELSRRDIALYEDLGRRLKALERLDEEERAHTSIVEMLPNESESHAKLAEIRQGQDRWPEAIAHWREVARIRALEPTGLLKLAAAQIHEHQWDEAAQSLDQLRRRSWPPRFGDVPSQIRELERQLE